MENLIEIAKLGKSVGLDGTMKCYLLTDFPEIFKAGRVFHATSNSSFNQNIHTLTLKHFDQNKQIIRFEEIQTPEHAKKLTNLMLSCSIQDTREFCKLKQDEFFWFDIIGCLVIENETTLGKVKDIQRIANTDYLIIQTDKFLCKQFAKEFLIPYLENFILKADIETKIIYTKNAQAILEAS